MLDQIMIICASKVLIQISCFKQDKKIANKP